MIPFFVVLLWWGRTFIAINDLGGKKVAPRVEIPVWVFFSLTTKFLLIPIPLLDILNNQVLFHTMSALKHSH